MKLTIALLILMSNLAQAAKVADLEILDLSLQDKETFQFKMKTHASRLEDYFFLSFDKSNRQNMDQLALVMLKMLRGSQVKIDADIPSFSIHPAGGFYTVSDINITLRGSRNPDQVKKTKLPNN